MPKDTKKEIEILRKRLIIEVNKNAEEFARGLEKGREQGEYLGEQRGREIGREEEKIEVAKRLDNLNMTEYQISRATGLSRERVKEIIAGQVFL